MRATGASAHPHNALHSLSNMCMHVSYMILNQYHSQPLSWLQDCRSVTAAESGKFTPIYKHKHAQVC